MLKACCPGEIAICARTVRVCRAGSAEQYYSETVTVNEIIIDYSVQLKFEFQLFQDSYQAG